MSFIHHGVHGVPRSFLSPFVVIQSEAKDLEDTAQPKVDVHEILRRDAPLDDN